MKKLCMLIVSLMTITSVFASNTEPVEVWGTKVSPFVRKVVATLEYKNVDYTNHEVLPAFVYKLKGERVPAGLEKASPLGKIPALTQGDFTVADSSVIVAYIEKQFGGKSVYPKDAEGYAKALWYEKYADTKMTEVIHDIFIEKVVKPVVLKAETDQEKVEKLVSDKLPEILEYLESSLSKNSSLYLVGDSLTIADIAVANHLVSLDLANIEVSKTKYPTLNAYFKNIKQEAAFKKALPELN